jgi:hypothetical protein
MPYVFRHGYARITTREFPHSEIPGSKVGQHLPEAYRSRPRPSSALGAKASTVCPCSLDSERTRFRCRYGVFKVRAGQTPAVQKARRLRAPEGAQSRTVSQNSTAYGCASRCDESRCEPHHVDESRRNSRRVVSPDEFEHELDASTGTTASGVIAPDSLERR